MKTERTYIYGKHAVIEAIQLRPSMIKEIWLQGTMTPDLKAIVRKNSIIVHNFDGKALPRGFEKDAVHQGFIALITPEELVMPYRAYIEELEITPDTALVILSEIQDPHNVGAIIRSAAAFGVSGVILGEHRQAGVSGSVVKVSAGAAFTTPLIQAGNINATLEDLKKRGFWIYGLAGGEGSNITEEKFDRPTVFVVGNEGAGIREKTREHCDILLSIPIHEKVESLNASVSAAVALYAWSSQHKGVLRK